MRRWAPVVLVVLAGCGGGSAKVSPPTTQPTTAVDVCVRVSAFFAEHTLRPSTSARLGATQQDVSHWYVANADGAIWLTTVDPAAGVDQSGLLAPLNPQAAAAASFGQPRSDDPRLAGYGTNVPRAQLAAGCPQRTEEPMKVSLSHDTVSTLVVMKPTLPEDEGDPYYDVEVPDDLVAAYTAAEEAAYRIALTIQSIAGYER